MSYANNADQLKRNVRRALDVSRLKPWDPSSGDRPDPSALVRRIKDRRWCDADLAAHIYDMSAHEASDGSINALTSVENLLPVQLAVIYDRPLTVRAMFHAGANLWLDRVGWVEMARTSSCLPALREVLALIAPRGVRVGPYVPGGESVPSFPPPRPGFPLPFPPDDDLGAWFDLAAQMVVSATESLTDQPDQVMRFLLSVREAWPDRPHDKGISWSDVMTQALDSMVASWLTPAATTTGTRLPPPQDCVSAICRLVDWGADPRPDRVLSFAHGNPVVWSDWMRTANALWGMTGLPEEVWTSSTKDLISWMTRLAAAEAPMSSLAPVAKPHSETNPSTLQVVADITPSTDLFVVDIDEIPGLATVITDHLMDNLVARMDLKPKIDLDEASDDELLVALSEPAMDLPIPIGRHGVLSIDYATGRPASVALKNGLPGRSEIRAAVHARILQVLPDVLETVPPDVLVNVAVAAHVNPWLDVQAIPGVRQAAWSPHGASFRVGALKTALSLPLCDRPIDISGKGEVEKSLQSRLVTRLATQSWDDVAFQTVRAFIDRVDDVRRIWSANPQQNHPLGRLRRPS